MSMERFLKVKRYKIVIFKLNFYYRYSVKNVGF
jgi:hypothetical protein